MALRIRKKPKKPVHVQITSLCDIMTTLLIFLLKTFISEGQLLSRAADLTLPFSTSKKVMQTPDLIVAISQSSILVDEIPIAKSSDVLETFDALVEPLRVRLEEKRQADEALSQAMGEEFAGRVIIQAHKDITYKLLYKVMYTCGLVGYNNMELVASMMARKGAPKEVMDYAKFR